MTKQMIARRAFCDEHKALMLNYKRARGGDRLKALAKLKQYMLERLREARQ